MKRTWLFLALSSAALFIGALLSLFLRDWVRDQVVIPLDYLFWTLRLGILSIPQVVFWVILVFIGLGIAIWASRPVSTYTGPRTRPTVSASVSRYHNWLRYVAMVNSSRFASDNLARDLIRLTVQTLAYQHNLTPDEVFTQLEVEDLGLLPELRAFVRRRGFQSELALESRWMELFHRLFPSRTPPRPPGVYTPVEREASQVLSQIEQLLSQPESSQVESSPEEAAP